MNLFTGLEEIVAENEPLGKYTWLKIGGPARYLVRPRSQEELSTVIERCRNENYPWKILGQGANLLIDSKGLNAVVIKLDHIAFKEIEIAKSTVTAGGGASLSLVIQESIKKGLSGMEVLVGIPGSVGGAVKMNAGGRFGDIGTLVSRIKVVDKSGTCFWREKPELNFEYRNANIHDQIVVAAELELMSDDPQRILSRMKETWILKKTSQPLSLRSAGCVFKNPAASEPAGLLIDKAGLKGKAIGGAMVSEQHANFIINQDTATFEDIFALINLVRKTISDRYGIDLELEIELWQDGK
ncbi:MAG: UDP-N-acetylmuramate dehydrogenase [Phycisphaerae bacterium]